MFTDLVHSSCSGGFSNIDFSQFWKLGSPRSGSSLGWLSSCLSDDHLLAVSLQEKSSLSSLLQGHWSHSIGFHPHHLITSQRPTSLYHHIVVRIVIYKFGEGKWHKHSVHNIYVILFGGAGESVVFVTIKNTFAFGGNLGCEYILKIHFYHGCMIDSAEDLRELYS